MPLKPPIQLLRGVAGRAALWLLPAFVLWWMLLTPVLMPLLEGLAGTALQRSFESIEATLLVQNNGDWHIGTRVLMAEQPEDTQKRRFLTIDAQSAQNLSFGLPMLWILLLAIPHRRLRHLGLGSGIVLLTSALMGWFLLSKMIVITLADGQIHYVFVTQHISHRLEPFAAWQAESLRHLYRVLLYMNVFFLPAFLAYYLNRSWWQAQFKHPNLRSHDA